MSEKFRTPDVKSSDTRRLTDGEVDLLRKHFDENRKSGASKGDCEVCGHNDWKIWPSLHTLTVFDIVRDVHEHGQVHLVYTISCDNCGNVKQFDAKKAGLASRSAVRRSK